MADDYTGKVYKPNIILGTIAKVPYIILLFLILVVRSPLFFEDPVFLAFSVAVLFPILLVVAIGLKVQRYELKENEVFVKKGIISKSQVHIPYSEIQDINENQGIGQRIFGLKTLNLITMSQIGRVSLVQLKPSEISEIKSFITSAMRSSSKSPVAASTIGLESEIRTSQFEIHPLKKFPIIFIFLVIVGAIVTAILSLFNLGIFSLIIPGGIIFLLGVALFVVYLIQKISFKIRLGADFLTIGSVFLLKNFINLPYSKIQDIGMSRDLIDRLCHLTSLTIETGEPVIVSGSQKNVPLNAIPSLDESDAEKITKFVLDKMGHADIDTADIRSKFPLERIKPLKKTIKFSFWMLLVLGSIFALIEVLKAYLANFPFLDVLSTEILALVLLGVSILAFISKFIYEIMYFRRYDYSDNDEIFVLTKGVFTIKDVVVSYEKIQNIFVDRDIFDKMFGLFDVHMSTIGAFSQMELHVDGLNEKNAEGLRDFLLRRIEKR